MKINLTRIKPVVGYSHFVHLGLIVLLPIFVYVLVRLDFVQLAFGLVLLSKWRVFAVKPRYWPALIRNNAVDAFVGISIVVFMTHTDAANWQLVWAGLYGLWLVFLKPGSKVWQVSLQALIGQMMGLTALFLAGGSTPLLWLVAAGWSICYLSARHFYSSFDEPHTALYAYTWGYFSGALIWVLGHWLVFYGSIAQATLLLSVIGLVGAAIYYLDETDKLSLLLKRQLVFGMVAVVLVILVLSGWGDNPFSQ